MPAERVAIFAERAGAGQMSIVNPTTILTAQESVDRPQPSNQARPDKLSTSPALSFTPAIANRHDVSTVPAI